MSSEPNNGGHLEAGGEDFDRVFAGANPNPNRVGCPSADVLRALATKQRPIGDPAYEHLAQCSPCYREFRKVQTAIARPAKRKAYFATAAAAVMVLAGISIYLLQDKVGHPLPAEVMATKPDVPPVKLLTADLRNGAPTRGSRQPSTGITLTLSRNLLQLTLILPVGSEPGRYTVRVLRGTGEVVAAATADATIVNFATTLTAELDLRALEPAVHQLEITRAGEHAHSYPALVE
jgi:hypothetical protein